MQSPVRIGAGAETAFLRAEPGTSAAISEGSTNRPIWDLRAHIGDVLRCHLIERETPGVGGRRGFAMLSLKGPIGLERGTYGESLKDDN
jgi:hypothetical protein